MYYNSRISYRQQLFRLRIIGCLYCFNNLYLDILSVIIYKLFMRDKNYFLRPCGLPLLSACRRKLSLNDSTTPQAISIFSGISSFTKKSTSLNR